MIRCSSLGSRLIILLVIRSGPGNDQSFNEDMASSYSVIVKGLSIKVNFVEGVCEVFLSDAEPVRIALSVIGKGPYVFPYFGNVFVFKFVFKFKDERNYLNFSFFFLARIFDICLLVVRFLLRFPDDVWMCLKV